MRTRVLLPIGHQLYQLRSLVDGQNKMLQHFAA